MGKNSAVIQRSEQTAGKYKLKTPPGYLGIKRIFDVVASALGL